MCGNLILPLDRHYGFLLVLLQLHFTTRQNFKALKNSGKPYLIRTPLIPNITDTKENLSAIKSLIGESNWEQLPYNTMAGAKYKMPGMEYNI